MTKVALLYAAGTNCDREMALAFELAGATVDYLHINELKAAPDRLDGYNILGIPGGFTYGDYIAAGRILANELRFRLRDALERFVEQDKLILGVCNGFQVLVKAGLLPGLGRGIGDQRVTLEFNDSHRFEDRWVWLQPVSKHCVFLKGMEQLVYLPVAHAEGKFVTDTPETLTRIVDDDLLAVRYVHPEGKAADYPWNPNGSLADIAGICDPTGRVFGLMPHPERFVRATQHPTWTRTPIEQPDGLLMYRNAVEYAEANL